MAESEGAEPFPSLSQPNSRADVPPSRQSERGDAPVGRKRASSVASISSSIGSATRARGASVLSGFMSSNPPLGMWQATAEVGSKIPTLPEIKNGSFDAEGWSHEGQMEQRGNTPHETHRRRMARTSSASQRTRGSTLTSRTPGTPATIPEVRETYFPVRETLVEATMSQEKEAMAAAAAAASAAEDEERNSSEDGQKLDGEAANADTQVGPDATGTYPNGYRFPKKHTWTQSIVIGSKALWGFFLTPFGFVITIYGLNVVAWGAMIFFVLLNAAPAMCHPSCNDLRSARKKWIEIDSQVLNGLFCVTGFGLIPWRFRDLYFLMRWRIMKEEHYFRKLAGIHRSWFRLPGSEHLSDDIGPPPVYSKKNPQLPESPPPYSEEEIAILEANPAIPLPVTSMPEPPLTGIRAQPTRPIMIDIVVWMYVFNTFFQIVLASFMWVYNRFTRPSWATGFFISIGCVVAIIAGIVVFIEGSKVKKVEGIPVHEYDVFETVEEAQARKAKKDAKHRKHMHEMKDQETYDQEVQRELTLERTQTQKLKGKHWFTRH